MRYAPGWYIVDENTVHWSQNGRRFADRNECFDAVLAENAKGYKTLKHIVVDTEDGIAMGREWMRVEAVDNGPVEGT
jgi:hypothetical protein